MQTDSIIEGKRSDIGLLDDNPWGVGLFENMAIQEVNYQVEKTCAIPVLKSEKLHK
jgi:hypothetical protein